MTTAKQPTLRLACEFGAERIVAAHAENGIVDLTAVRTFGTGALLPNLTAANLVHREIVRTAIQEAMAAVTSRSRDVIAIVPDNACRVVLLDFDTLPSKREEADAIVRFRLKKALPFDVERTRVSYQAQAPENGKTSVIAAVMLNSVLEEYESVLREAGCTPGVVLPSTLAALGQVDASVPTLAIKVDRTTTSVAIVDQQRLVLLRTLDNPAEVRLDAAQLAEDIYPSLIFFQDTYGTRVERILVGGVESLEALNSALEEYTGIRAQDLVSAAHLGASAASNRPALAAVVGALAS